MSCFAILKALFTRIIFAAHSFICIWRVVDVLGNNWFWLMLLGLLLLLIESLVTLVKRKGHEWKWFCPSFFCFLLAVVPAIWLLEIDRLDRKGKSLLEEQSTNETYEEKLSDIYGFEMPIILSADQWVLAIEQSLLLLLIVGRWMLPKGEITREQLSQLLFAYIGMASDIMEILYLFEEKAILYNEILRYAILSVWTVSLVQFCLVYTATKSRKPRPVWIAPDRNNSKKKIKALKHDNGNGNLCCETEFWAIGLIVLMQDGPFLSVRLFSIIKYNIFNYTIIFFTTKNILVLLLQFYRLVVVIIEKRKKSEKEEVIIASDDLLVMQRQPTIVKTANSSNVTADVKVELGDNEAGLKVQ